MATNSWIVEGGAGSRLCTSQLSIKALLQMVVEVCILICVGMALGDWDTLMDEGNVRTIYGNIVSVGEENVLEGGGDTRMV